MYIPFDQIADTARLWVYQANRPLTDAEVAYVGTTLQPALDAWAAHGHPLAAAAQVKHNRFVVIAVDEAQGLPSGCSIDKSVGWLRELSAALGVDFRPFGGLRRHRWQRTNSPLPAIKTAVASEVLTPDTLIFNNLVATKAEFEANWQIPAGQSWLKRYFNAQTVSN